MANILVSLISKQTIPNILFIKEFGDKIDKYLFISTPEMVNELKAIKLVCGINGQNSDALIIDADDLNDLGTKLENIKYPQTDKYIVNLTGGTKIMALSAFLEFSKKDSTMYYQAIDKANTISQVYPVIAPELRDSNLLFRLNVKDYINANGLDITNENSIFVLSQPESYTKEYFSNEYWTKHQSILMKIIDLWETKKRTEKYGQEPSYLDLPIEIIEILKLIHFPNFNGKTINRKQKEFLTGGWLEEFTFIYLRDKYSLPDEHIAINVKIKKKTGNTSPNELDVAFILDNNLHVIECKSGTFNKENFEKYIYKLDAIRQDFGLTNKAYLMIYNGIRDFKDPTKINDAYARRATNQKIKLMDRLNYIDIL